MKPSSTPRADGNAREEVFPMHSSSCDTLRMQFLIHETPLFFARLMATDPKEDDSARFRLRMWMSGVETFVICKPHLMNRFVQ